MLINQPILSYIMPTAKKELLPTYAYYLNTLPQKFGINTPRRMAAFMAQFAHESGELREIKEKWNGKGHQKTYEGNTQIGNKFPGDGKKFLGRGGINITGRENYARFGKDFFNDANKFTNNPELVEQPYYAVLSAIWFWTWKKLNVLADANNFPRITQIINRLSLGKEQRLAYYRKALQIFSGAENVYT